MTPVPYSFVRDHLKISWCDALWGYDQKLFCLSDIIDLAIDRLCEGSNDSMVVDLVGLKKNDVLEGEGLLRKLAAASPQEESDRARKKWLYLILAFLFENRLTLADPLAEVETIYADFDYPSEIEGFVRYMPVTDGYDPSAHTSDDNERRLFEKWREYLVSTASEFDGIVRRFDQ